MLMHKVSEMEIFTVTLAAATVLYLKQAMNRNSIARRNKKIDMEFRLSIH